MTGSGLIDSVFSQPEFLAQLESNRTKAVVGSFLEAFNSVAVVGISVLLYPVLKRHSESIALGYLGSRLVEATLLACGIAMTLTLLIGGNSDVATGSANDAYRQTIGSFAVAGRGATFELAMLALASGSILFCVLLYRTKLVPRALSLLGLVGYASLLASSGLTIGGFEPSMILYIPGGIFEIVFPVWLIARGFATAK
ncbi:DUF4386 domain-containing protein [Paenibacillus sp. TRM 82003]|nr:DUF4386 domain-containing protein [Paenibacillus sp. TRM 82003]